MDIRDRKPKECEEKLIVASNTPESICMNKLDLKTLATAIFFLIFGMFIFAYLSSMLVRYPLFEFKVDEINWTREWLYMTILDYYGAALSLGAVTLYSEPPFYAVLWISGFCLLGSPICCSYVIYRYGNR